MPAESVDGARSSHDFTSVRQASRNEIFLARLYGNALSFNDQRVATLHHQHVFVIFMHMLGGNSIFGACPKGHLASFLAVENVAFNTRRCLS